MPCSFRWLVSTQPLRNRDYDGRVVEVACLAFVGVSFFSPVHLNTAVTEDVYNIRDLRSGGALVT
jgi:hypothetical protein